MACTFTFLFIHRSLFLTLKLTEKIWKVWGKNPTIMQNIFIEHLLFYVSGTGLDVENRVMIQTDKCPDP